MAKAEEYEHPKDVERHIDRTLLRIALIAVAVLTVVVVAGAVIQIQVLRGQARAGKQRDQIIEKINSEFDQHRQRNEDIHSCIVEKYDSLRRDIAALLKTPPGTLPIFPADDGINCPPIDVNGNTVEPPPFTQPSTSTTPTTVKTGP